MSEMLNPTILVTGLVFLTVILAVAGTSSFWETKQQGQELRRRVSGKGALKNQAQGQKVVQKRFFGLLEWLGKTSQPKDAQEVTFLKKSLVRAGYREHRAPMYFSGAKIILLLIGIVIFTLIHVFIFPLLSTQLVYGLYVGVALLFFYLPNFWLNRKTSKRKDNILKAIPPMLDLLVVCVEAGLGLDAAIKRVGEEIKVAHQELYDEFQILTLELRAGQSRITGLKNLADRTNLDEMRSLVALLVQTDRFGTSLAQALRVHADTVRKNRRFKAEEYAATLPVKLMFPVVLFIFPSLFLVLLGPAVVRGIRILLPTLAQ